MMKRSLLAVAVTALTSQAVYAAPYMPMDARGMAMGNTGVASAKRAHAPAYNPSLLAQGSEKDDFAILLPQVGVQVSDEQEIIDEAELLSDEIIPRFEKAVEGENGIGGLDNALNSFTNDPTNPAKKLTLQNSLDEVQQSVVELDNSLKNISGNPLSANLGLNVALAIPSKKFAAALSVGGTAGISGRVKYSQADSDLFTSYVPEVQELVDFVDAGQIGPLPESEIIDYRPFLDDANTIPNPNFLKLTENAKDPSLTSSVQLVAYAIADVGISFAREFEFAGEKVAIGITPKLQKISTFHYVAQVDGFDEVDSDDLKDSQEDYTRANLDIGASYRFGASEKWMVGLTAKNLMGGEFDYKPITVGGETYRGSVELNPQFRAGVAYNGEWTSIALDVDLVENDPVAFENPTQYAALGVELDVFSFLQLRAGYRTNMSVSGDDVASIGVGLSPFGLHLDIAAMANLDEPKKNAGAALQLGFYF